MNGEVAPAALCCWLAAPTRPGATSVAGRSRRPKAGAGSEHQAGNGSDFGGKRCSFTPSKAAEKVKTLLKALGVRKPDGGWEKAIINFTLGPEGKKHSHSFQAFVAEARRSGTVPLLQQQLDAGDPWFQGFSLGVGPNMKIAQTFAGYSTELVGPARISPAELDLADDIVVFRTRACADSGGSDFADCARSYRAYVYACLSLVDAFINRYILIARHGGFDLPGFFGPRAS